MFKRTATLPKIAGSINNFLTFKRHSKLWFLKQVKILFYLVTLLPNFILCMEMLSISERSAFLKQELLKTYEQALSIVELINFDRYTGESNIIQDYMNNLAVKIPEESIKNYMKEYKIQTFKQNIRELWIYILMVNKDEIEKSELNDQSLPEFYIYAYIITELLDDLGNNYQIDFNPDNISYELLADLIEINTVALAKYIPIVGVGSPARRPNQRTRGFKDLVVKELIQRKKKNQLPTKYEEEENYEGLA